MLYEYAGFKFVIDEDRQRAIAMPFQHQAAYKEKHARNAFEQYLSENKQCAQ